MKTRILGTELLLLILLLGGVPLGTLMAGNSPVRPYAETTLIPMDQIGTLAQKQYSGGGLSVVATNGGALLRCVFQRLEGEVTRDGLWLKSTVPEQAEDCFRVKAVAVGQLSLPERGDVSVDGETVRFSRPGLVEEYSVSLDGVRQDFVVLERPHGEAALKVHLQVAGTMVERIAVGAQLVLKKSGRKVTYSRLKVTDANGKELPARIEVASTSTLQTPPSEFPMAVVVNDADALYPVRIDPTFTDENWIPMGGIPGVNGWVYATAVDAAGNLFVGGNFTVAGNVFATNVAKWNGANWTALGFGVNGTVNAIVVSGNEVYVGGGFTTAGGAAANRVAKWDGTNWSALGSGMDGGVSALVVSGGQLYAGGSFLTAGGNTVSNIARWTGSGWVGLGSGMNNAVLALAATGTDIYAGGQFTVSGGTVAFRVAKWNGSSWSALGDGMNSTVRALAFSGNELFAGGDFWQADFNPANRVARWNGTGWSAMAFGVGTSSFDATSVRALTVLGTNLYVGGNFQEAGGTSARCIAKWNGSSWSGLGAGIGVGGGDDSLVLTLAAWDTNIFVGGNLVKAGGLSASGVARWELTVSSWRSLGVGAMAAMRALVVSGTNVYAAGSFVTQLGYSIDNIVRWNGNIWIGLEPGIKVGTVHSLAAAGTNVYAAGAFTNAGVTPANYIARWNGVAWSALGSGLSGFATAVAVSGSNVYVAGQFTNAGGVAADHIAKWNGSSWSALGLGLDGYVHALAVSGNDVYVGGEFTHAGGIYTPYVARWNGTNWSALGDGMDNYVRALAVSGSNVYAGGDFITAGGSSASGIARWNGNTWSALGAGFYPAVYALAVSSNDLYAGGWFTTVGSSNFVAKWNGTNWTGLGSGLGGVSSPQVFALAATSNSVYVGGDFLTAGGKVSAYVARAFTGEEYIYATNNGAITITKYTGPGGAVNVPTTINGLPVVSIGDSAFGFNNSIRSVIIPFGVTNIGATAFGFSDGITNISLPNSVRSIGVQAFARCSSLTSITIPASATNVNQSAFDYCWNLPNITFDPQNPVYRSIDGVWFNKAATRLITCPPGRTGNYSVPEGVTTIGRFSFRLCTALTNIFIPRTASLVEQDAFQSCAALSGVYFFGNAPSIGTDIFFGVTSATVYYFPGTTGWFSTLGGRPTVLINAPMISSQPASRTNVVGTSASFLAIASGASPLSYQWRKDGTNLSNGGSISGVTTTNLNITSSQINHAGNYTVVVTNSYGSTTSSVAVLTVLLPRFEIITTNGGFGISNGIFGFYLTGLSGQTLVIEQSTNLINWTGLQTNLLSSDTIHFVDPHWTNFAHRFYRIRSP